MMLEDTESHVTPYRACRMRNINIDKFNRFRTAKGQCGVCKRLWNQAATDLCPCVEKHTMSHIVNSRPLTKLNGRLSQLHSADDEAIAWLTSYGSWCIQQSFASTISDSSWLEMSTNSLTCVITVKQLCNVVSRRFWKAVARCRNRHQHNAGERKVSFSDSCGICVRRKRMSASHPRKCSVWVATVSIHSGRLGISFTSQQGYVVSAYTRPKWMQCYNIT